MDPTKVDADWQVKNLPAPGGGNALWSQQTATLSQLTEYQNLGVDFSGNVPVNLVLTSPDLGLVDGFAIVGGVDVTGLVMPPVPVLYISNFGDGIIGLVMNDDRSTAANRFYYGMVHPLSFGNDLGAFAGAPNYTVHTSTLLYGSALGVGINPGMSIFSSVTQACTFITGVFWNQSTGIPEIGLSRAVSVSSGTFSFKPRSTLWLYGGQSALFVYDVTLSRWRLFSDASGVRFVNTYPSYSPQYDRGSLLVFNGFGWELLPVGVNGQVLTLDNTVRQGVKWA